MDYKYQIVSISVVIMIIIYFSKNKKLPLLSTKFFTAFLMTAFVNLIAEVLTIYGLNHYWTISKTLLRLFHQVFIGSLDLLIFSLYLYCCFLNNHQKRFTLKQMLPRMIPLTVSACMVLFGPLYYHISYGVKYSYGPMANTVYASIAIYMMMTFYVVNQKKGTLSKEVRRSCNFGLLIWVIVAAYQLFYPKALLSSVGVMLVVLFLFLSFENPREYLDVETDTLNRRAFHMVTNEYVEGKRNFYLFNIILKDMDNIQNVLGHFEAYGVQRQIGAYIKNITNETIFHSRSDTLTLIFFQKKQADFLYQQFMNNQFEYQAKDIVIVPKLCIHILEYPQYASSLEDIFETLDYIRTKYHDEGDEAVYVDEEIIRQKNYYAQVEKLVDDAVANQGFEVYYQPIYDVREKTFSSAEALVRLKNDRLLGYVSPEIFVPIAEERGQIKELGHAVFESVCDFSNRNHIEEKGVKYIEVNLSGIQGTDKEIVNQLKNCMEKNKITPCFINLEITETAETTGGDKLKSNMEKLIALGCHFSMDDFGTGYSNLAKMANGGFSIIKLDKSLLWSCFDPNEDRQKAEVILNNCINMILHLGMQIVAEGVETLEQAEFLIDKGVNYLQGYYYSKPIPQSAYLRFLETQNRSKE